MVLVEHLSPLRIFSRCRRRDKSYAQPSGVSPFEALLQSLSASEPFLWKISDLPGC